MSKIVQVKTPLELQEFLWKDGVLVRREDLTAAEIINIETLRSKMDSQGEWQPMPPSIKAQPWVMQEWAQPQETFR